MKRQYRFTRQDFMEIRARLHRCTGIALSDNKDAMVYSRLSRRLTALSLTAFSDYVNYLDQDPDEIKTFVDALTTNKTAFFRENHHFDFLKTWFSKQESTITIWCAACSSGEEAYSTAMTCAASNVPNNANFHIYASDINSEMLEAATQAVYPVSMLEQLPVEYLKAYCQRGKNNKKGWFRINPNLSSHITFLKQNLLDKIWHLPHPIDVVFCRNVMIYFDKPTQKKLLNRFEQILKPGGLYFAGHSEQVTQLCDSFIPLGNTVYQKVVV